ncbi:DUF2244 domain-containing protein [Marinobacter pelagius]|uniref:DUF2244 domain-containing protein n=1 Tax=Marinobacter sp. C7 TaxID=2951363 RepID=UPI001EEFC810|nr:DUF2244 domain-containing protein [Marinobacter sp. C7]MCG7198871.1 DUF2244 domain-containing protein [Marinobacter sp. C7]
MVEQLDHPGGARLLLTPNRSLSWKGNVRIWMGLAVISLIIGIGWALAGAWIILPFAGLELIAVAAGIYITSRDCQRKEVLTMADDTILLEKGRKQKSVQWTLPRPYTRLQMNAPVHPFAPAKLFLSHRDDHVSLGGFLNVEDTERLIKTLEALGFTVERKQPDPEIGLWF